MIYIVELQYYDTNDSAVKTAYFGTEGFAFKPTDTPANVVVEPRIESPALIRRDIFDVATTGGASRVGFGELVLRNDDGALDSYAAFGFDGRSITVRIADSLASAYPAGFVTLFTGTMDEVEVSRSAVRVRIRDRGVFAARAFQTTKYAGTNVLPDGVEGLDSDLKGKPKPRVFGAVFNIEPICVNTSKLIYQVNDGEIRDVMAAYDSGALLRRDLPNYDYDDLADLLANQPAPGTYRVWKAGGMFRLGSAPVGQLTCDVIEGLTPMRRTAAALWQRVAINAGIDPSDISETDYAALDEANRSTLGLYIRDETSNAAVLDDIARTVGAWWATDTEGVMRMQRLEAPSGEPVIDITEDVFEEESLRRVPMNSGGLPTYRVTVRGVRNYTVQTSGLVGVVGSARRARLAQPFQDGIATDTSVQTAFLLATDLTVESAFSCLLAAQAEAARLLDLYKVKRDRFEVTVRGDAALLGAIDLGVVVRITSTRFGLSLGKLFRVIGYQLDPTTNSASLTVWG